MFIFNVNNVLYISLFRINKGMSTCVFAPIDYYTMWLAYYCIGFG